MDKQAWLYERADAQLRQQLANVDSLNSVANAHFIAAGVLMAVYVAALSGDFAIGAWIGVVPTLAAIVTLTISYRIGDWHNGPNVDLLVWHTVSADEIATVMIEATKSIAGLYSANEKKQERKSSLINWGGLLLIVGIIGPCAWLAWRLFSGVCQKAA